MLLGATVKLAYELNTDYPQRPGVGEDHALIWANCGAYDRPIQETRAVHSFWNTG